jgi:cytoskeletal protein CcmA (bactofilin family)
MATNRTAASPQPSPAGFAPNLGDMRRSAEPTPSASPRDEGSQLIVGRDIQVKGEILSCGTLIVEGRVEASMDSNVIRIAEGGVFIGEVGIDTAEIMGKFEGKLTARKRLIIHPTGRVTGTIRYGAIQIQEGGQITGDVQVIEGGTATRPRDAASGTSAARSGEAEQRPTG